MVDKEILNKLCLFVIENGENITTKVLKELGFDYKIINQLLEAKIISRVKRGEYLFEGNDLLWELAYELKNQKEYDVSIRIFEYCYKHDINKAAAAYELVVNMIFTNQHEDALAYFNDFDEKYNCDKLILLYLISIIDDIPLEYKEKISGLTKEDVCIVSSNAKDNYRNYIYTLIIQGNFTYASKLINETAQNQKLSRMLNMIRYLLYKVIKIDFNYRDKIKGLVKNHSYEMLIDLLKEKQNKYQLSNPEKAIMKLAGVIMDLKKGIEVSVTTNSDARTAFEAVEAGDYELAIELNHSSREKFGKNTYSELFEILLKEVLTLSLPKEEVVAVQDFAVSIDEHMELFIQKILASNVDAAMDHVKEVLAASGNSIYEKLIVDLIKVSLLKKDISFSKVMSVLFLMKDSKYEFNSSVYLSEFYMAISQNKIDEAKIYYGIIERYGDYAIDLKTMHTMLTRMPKNSEVEVVKDPKKEEAPSKPVKVKDDTLKPNKESVTPKKSVRPNVTIDYAERKSFEERREYLLENKGLILLKPMSRERRHAIYKLTREYSNVSAFGLGGDVEVKPVVLKYSAEEKLPREEYHKLFLEAETLYQEKKFRKCLEVFLDLLSRGKSTAYMYAKVGLTYLYLKKVPKAIEYLTVANNLEDKNRDYTELIMKLKGQIPEEERKPDVFMREQDFYNFDKYFTLEAFMSIINEIQALGLDVESGCKQLGKTEEETERIILLSAKMYYLQNNQEQGDEFLNYFFKKDNKHPINLDLAKDIQRNKKIYLARKEERTLSLKLRAL